MKERGRESRVGGRRWYGFTTALGLREGSWFEENVTLVEGVGLRTLFFGRIDG